MLTAGLLALFPVLMMTSAPPADWTTIAKGTLSGVERPRQVVVRHEADWRALWKEHAPEQGAPAIDFSTRTVVAVFLGSRRTAGYDVTITGVEPRGDGTVVRYRETRPGPHQMVAQIVTTPFHIVSVRAIRGAVTFAEDHDR